MRVKGFYLTMATLAAQFILPWFTRNAFPEVLNGAQGLNVQTPVLFGIDFNTPQKYLMISLTVLIISTVAALNISRSRLGRAFVAIRDHDLAAELLVFRPPGLDVAKEAVPPEKPVERDRQVGEGDQ